MAIAIDTKQSFTYRHTTPVRIELFSSKLNKMRFPIPISHGILDPIYIQSITQLSNTTPIHTKDPWKKQFVQKTISCVFLCSAQHQITIRQKQKLAICLLNGFIIFI